MKHIDESPARLPLDGGDVIITCGKGTEARAVLMEGLSAEQCPTVSLSDEGALLAFETAQRERGVEMVPVLVQVLGIVFDHEVAAHHLLERRGIVLDKWGNPRQLLAPYEVQAQSLFFVSGANRSRVVANARRVLTRDYARYDAKVCEGDGVTYLTLYPGHLVHIVRIGYIPVVG